MITVHTTSNCRKRQRLSLFIASLRGGGAQRVMVELANGFAARGHAVDLVLGRAEGPYVGSVSQEVRVIDLKAPRLLAAMPGLVRYLRREKPRSLLSALDDANVVSLWACMLAQVPTRPIVSVHTTLSVSRHHGRARLLPGLARHWYSHAYRVIAVSKGVADDLISTLKVPENLVRVVYNPIVTPEILQMAREPLDHSWFTTPKVPVILGAGRLTEQKAFDVLIQAFAKMRRTRPLRLVILGEGRDRTKLTALAHKLGAEQDVAFLGFVKNPYAYMARAHLFVLSSAWEGFGNVLVEAMAMGTPVVATDCPSGPREILDGGNYGRLVPVGDIDRLAEAIRESLDSESHPNVVKRSQDFTRDRAVTGYLEAMGIL